MNVVPIATAFLDASVLYPALLRNILMRLALQGLFRARWSSRVQDEWCEALLRNRPDLSRNHVERTRRLMDTHLEDAAVVGFEDRIDHLSLPDADDRHVLAAAIHCGARRIVTSNLRDFPAAVLAGYGIEALHPDSFILGLVEADPDGVVTGLRRLLTAFKNPSLTAADLLTQMKRQGLGESADSLIGLI